MDKKKVQIFLRNAEAALQMPNYDKSLNADFVAIKKGKFYIRKALKELSKSDWVSVEDKLPEYMEKVFVTDKEHRDYVWISHRENGDTPKILDNNGFPAWQYHYPYYPVTHWKLIEKLEE